MPESDARSFVDDYRGAVIACLISGKVVATFDIPRMLQSIETAHALGPVMDPTLYRDKFLAMDEDKEILEAALPLWNLIKTLEAKKKMAAQQVIS